MVSVLVSLLYLAAVLALSVLLRRYVCPLQTLTRSGDDEKSVSEDAILSMPIQMQIDLATESLEGTAATLKRWEPWPSSGTD